MLAGFVIVMDFSAPGLRRHKHARYDTVWHHYALQARAESRRSVPYNSATPEEQKAFVKRRRATAARRARGAETAWIYQLLCNFTGPNYYLVTLMGLQRTISMKLARDEISRSGNTPPLQLFQQGIRAEATRRKYVSTLRRILCGILEDVLEGDFKRRAGQFVRRGRDDQQWMTDLLLSLSWKLRGRSDLPRDHADYLNPTSFKTYFKPIASYWR